MSAEIPQEWVEKAAAALTEARKPKPFCRDCADAEPLGRCSNSPGEWCDPTENDAAAVIAAVLPDVRRAVAEETLRRVLHDLDGTEVSKADVDGNAGTYMQAVHGGDTDESEDWRAAWAFARSLASPTDRDG